MIRSFRREALSCSRSLPSSTVGVGAHHTPDHRSVPSVTMYDPARDIYTLSDGPPAAKRKDHQAQSQEHQLDAAGTVRPGSGQRMSPGAPEQGVSDVSSTAIVSLGYSLLVFMHMSRGFAILSRAFTFPSVLAVRGAMSTSRFD